MMNALNTMKYLNLINLPADFRTSPVHVKLQAVRLTREQGDPEVELDETIRAHLRVFPLDFPWPQ